VSVELDAAQHRLAQHRLGAAPGLPDAAVLEANFDGGRAADF
jgi:hypothetical protein